MRVAKWFVGILLVGVLAGCEVDQPQGKKTSLTPREVYEMREDKDVLIIDVRTPAEFQHERIREAVNKPLDEINEWLKELPKDKKIVFVCRSGTRSGHAQRLAQREGYENTYNMAGGMLAWRREGLPVASGE